MTTDPAPRLKPFILLIGAISLVSLYFWLGSRYPALDLKALMGNQATISGIGFDILLLVEPNQPLLQRIIYTTVNWIYTNIYGMTFGLILAPLVLSLFSLRPVKPINNAVLASIAGALAGFPLGVCANCATPIAQGLQSAKARLETVLALIVSSPSLNIVVLTMMLNLLPFYFVVIKLVTTLLIIILVIPLLSKTANLNTLHNVNSRLPQAPTPKAYTQAHSQSWLATCQWLSHNIINNFIYITKITVPLMLLAGLLGAIVITVLPPESLLNAEVHGYPAKIMVLFATATVGTLLPIPIAFDAIFVAVLHELNLAPKYSITLLVTLGSFSIYPCLVIGRSTSLRFASLFTGTLIIIGFVAGLAGHYITPIMQAKERQHIYKIMGQQAPSLTVIEHKALRQANTLKPTPITLNANKILQTGNIAIYQMAYQAHSIKNTGTSQLFTRYFGDQKGINTSYLFSAENQTDSTFFRSIASGDTNNDNWPDILLVDSDGPKLFINNNGIDFQQLPLPATLSNIDTVTVATLVDLSNDGLLDIVVASSHNKLYWVANSPTGFSATLHKLDNLPKAFMASSLGFADLNKDGQLDIFIGNWSVGSMATHIALASSQNGLLLSSPSGYQLSALGCDPGETLTSLFSDINHDNNIDLLVGNDFAAPDCIYLGNTSGELILQNMETNPLNQVSLNTMSYSVGDTNNDGLLDIFSSDLTPANKKIALSDSKQVCALYKFSPKHYQNCQNIAEFTLNIAEKQTLKHCDQLTDKQYKQDCLVTVLYARILDLDISCDHLPPSWVSLTEQCQRFHTAFESPAKQITPNSPMASLQTLGNKMLIQDQNHRFEDSAHQWQVRQSGWAWNAQFADLNNDQWLDLYLVNGSHERRHAQANQLFLNDNGQKFRDISTQSGLDSLAVTASYTYLDLDNDGDIDIVTNPLFGPVEIYKNNSPHKNSIQFELSDLLGNRNAIGAKVMIHYDEDKIQIRELRLSGGFSSYNQSLIHFGLGEFNKIDAVSIIWPDGKKTTLQYNFNANYRYILERN